MLLAIRRVLSAEQRKRLQALQQERAKGGHGGLTQSEIRRALAGRTAEEPGAVMARMDRDHDGEVSREEFEWDSRRRFEFLDTNGDLVIAGTELSSLDTELRNDLCQASGQLQPQNATRPPGTPRRPGTSGDP